MNDDWLQNVAVHLEYRRFKDTCASIAACRRQWETARFDQARAELGYSSRIAWFTAVGARVVAPSTVQAVQATVTACASVLDIARPEVAWFLPETAVEADWRSLRGPQDLDQFPEAANLIGLAFRDANEIRVRADLPLRDAMATAAHECRHIAQTPAAGVDGYVANELDARAWEASFAAVMLTRN